MTEINMTCLRDSCMEKGPPWTDLFAYSATVVGVLFLLSAQCMQLFYEYAVYTAKLFMSKLAICSK